MRRRWCWRICWRAKQVEAELRETKAELRETKMEVVALREGRDDDGRGGGEDEGIENEVVIFRLTAGHIPLAPSLLAAAKEGRGGKLTSSK